MNRNTEAHFLTNPQARINRSTFDRSSDHKFTGNVGQLIPFYLDEVLPGDTFKVRTSKVIRLQNLISPIMDNLYMDTYWFFVPNRLVWDHWKEFMGENSSSAWIPQVEYQIPTVHGDVLTLPDSTKRGKIYDYLGIPPAAFENGLDVSALPFRGYHLIWNEFFRDQNLQAPVEVYKGDAAKALSDKEELVNTSEYPFLRNACKYHDQFTSALPAPQKGAAVDIGLGGFAPVLPRDELIPYVYKTDGLNYFPDGSPVVNTMFSYNYEGGSLYASPFTFDTSEGSLAPDTDSVANRIPFGSGDTGVYSNFDSNHFNPVNLFADLSGASSVTINQLRLAFQTQRLLENDARGGTRYIELLKSHFGVTSPDARLQRPEYLGGNRIPLSIQTVVQTNGAVANQPNQYTSPAAPGYAGVGQVGAMSHTVDLDDSFIHSFVEHGYVFGLCVVRYEHNYSQGLDRHWSRRDRLDYYWPEFANIGEQPIRNKEIFATGPLYNDDSLDESLDNGVFGYNEAWYEYRMKASRMSGQMRKGNGFDFWTIQDEYESQPYLSAGWIQEDLSNVDEVLRVKSSVADQFFADFYIANETTRPMPLFSIPGLIDHL